MTAYSVARIDSVYEALAESHAAFRGRVGRPLTLTEKILASHLVERAGPAPERGRSYVDLLPDRVAMQDATAQMALLQFGMAGRPRVALPTTVHCDHLVRARAGREADLAAARTDNAEVYAFLRSASARYGIGFWEPGSGIIHQVVLENYAFPGGMMIGTDSHTPNAGGLGMLAIGVGGADAMEVMAGLPFAVRWPKVIGVRLTGELDGWSSPKDVILKVCELLTVKGGTGAVVEYFGPGAESISATGKGTICNMGAELGATTSVFPFDASMARYLEATHRSGTAGRARRHEAELCADPEVLAEPARFYDRMIEIDLSTLPPLVVGPHTPDLARPLDELGAEAAAAGWPTRLSAALIGSCTNSSYEDMGRAASVAAQASKHGLKVQTRLMVTPGSDTIDRTIRRDGQMQALASVGATVLANACGPCIGQWQREDGDKGKPNSILTSYNRNFSGRNDGSQQTLAFISSPEVVVALALAGRLDFDPRRDSLTTPDGRSVKLAPPHGRELPELGLQTSLEGYVEPPDDGRDVQLVVAPDSERLQLLEPFAPTTPDQLKDLPVLLKVAGKCTTDHISAAGPWLRFRGHLQRISDNTFLGATNAFTGQVGKGRNVLTGQKDVPFPDVAKDYKARGLGWVAVGDVNYGEGSSREHAAMSPRYLGCRVVLARSFARIAETNLKKQGVLPLVFADPASWEKIREDDRLAFDGVDRLAPGSVVRVAARHADGSSDSFDATHSFDELQVKWFRAGSALNFLRESGAPGGSPRGAGGPLLRSLLMVGLALLGFGATAAAFRQIVPWPEAYGLRAKFEYFERNKDRFDTLFFGSSYTQRSVMPKVVDAVLAEQSGGSVQQTSFNFAVMGMQLWEMEHLQDEVLGLEPAKLKTIVMEPQFWRPHEAFTTDRFEDRAVFWHTPRLTLDVIEAVYNFGSDPWEQHAEAWLHVKMLARNLTNYAMGGRVLATLRGTSPTFDYLLPSDLEENHGYQDPETTRDELEIKDHERLARTLDSYLEEVALIDPANDLGDPDIVRRLRLDKQPKHLLLDQIRKLEGLGKRVICVMPPGLVASPEMRALHERGEIREFLAFNSPGEYPQFYVPGRRYDRGHMNMRGAEEFSRLLARRLLELGPDGPGH